MGYFPNGTAGDMYEERYCSRCIHGADPDKGCNVWLLHMLHNYDECNNPHSFLHTLIPRAGDGSNKECTMFVAAAGKERRA